MEDSTVLDELLDVVDEFDQVQGQLQRSEIYQRQLKNFRVINGFLINSKKQVWIPRRCPDKKLFPLCLDASVGGHVASGQTYEQAFTRELYEELAIQVTDVSYTLLAQLTPHTHNVSAYMHVYGIYTEVTPAYNKSDFMEASWYTIDELRVLIENGEKK